MSLDFTELQSRVERLADEVTETVSKLATLRDQLAQTSETLRDLKALVEAQL